MSHYCLLGLLLLLLLLLLCPLWLTVSHYCLLGLLPASGAYTPPPEPRRRTVYPTSFSRPAPGGPPIRFSDLSVFQLHREMGRVTTVDLDRLEDAMRADLALLEVIRAGGDNAAKKA